MSYPEATLPLMLHIVADDNVGMLFAAGSMNALFELGALTSLEVWSCAGMGCIVMSMLLTVCEGLFDHTEVKYQLDPKDPIHRMAMQHFVLLTQQMIQELPEIHNGPESFWPTMVLPGLGGSIKVGKRSIELLLLFICTCCVCAVGQTHEPWRDTLRCVILGILLLLTTAQWYRARWPSGRMARVLATYICDSAMKHSGAGVLLLPTTPDPTAAYAADDPVVCAAHQSGVAQEPLLVLTNTHVMPTMDRRTTKYETFSSLRVAVQAATDKDTTSAMYLDQMLLGPLNAYYTLNRMPLRCHNGQTLMVVDAWSLGPDYCSTRTSALSHKQMEDDMATVTGAPDRNSETVRLYTTRPISLIDTAYTVDDVRGYNLKDFYAKIHKHDTAGPVQDVAIVRDLLNWGYLCTCTVAGKKLLEASSPPAMKNDDDDISSIPRSPDHDEQKHHHPEIASDGHDPTYDNVCDDDEYIELVLKSVTLEDIVDLRPYETATYFSIHQFE
jgi:hypothetical protein